jgi:hypothetical protein
MITDPFTRILKNYCQQISLFLYIQFFGLVALTQLEPSTSLTDALCRSTFALSLSLVRFFATHNTFCRLWAQDWICFRLRLKCDGTRAETRFRRSAKRTSPFKSAGSSVQSTTGSRGVRVCARNAGQTMFRGSVKSTVYPLHSPFSASLPLPCVTVGHHISTELYHPLVLHSALSFLGTTTLSEATLSVSFSRKSKKVLWRHRLEGCQAVRGYYVLLQYSRNASTF